MKAKPKVLLIGIEARLQSRLNFLFSEMAVEVIKSADDFILRLDGLARENPRMICCGPALPDVPLLELAQSLRHQLPRTLLIGVATQEHALNSGTIKKNGFDRAFFMPSDSTALERAIRQWQNEWTLVSIPVDQLIGGAPLDFDLMMHLPKNERFVRIFKKGAVLRPELLQKFDQKGIRQLFIMKADEDRFEDYCSRVAELR